MLAERCQGQEIINHFAAKQREAHCIGICFILIKCNELLKWGPRWTFYRTSKYFPAVWLDESYPIFCISDDAPDVRFNSNGFICWCFIDVRLDVIMTDIMALLLIQAKITWRMKANFRQPLGYLFWNLTPWLKLMSVRRLSWNGVCCMRYLESEVLWFSLWQRFHLVKTTQCPCLTSLGSDQYMALLS